jgi:hypothetical protein
MKFKGNLMNTSTWNFLSCFLAGKSRHYAECAWIGHIGERDSGQCENILTIFTASRLALWPTHSPLQLVLGA